MTVLAHQPHATADPPLRRMPIPRAEPRPAVRVAPAPPTRPPRGQAVLALEGVGRVGSPAASGADGPPVPPPVGTWARQFVQAALEVSNGRRQPGQFLRRASDEVFARLSRRYALARRTQSRQATSPVVVRSMRLCRPADGVVEASAVVLDRGKIRAVALRLEDLAGQWWVSALEIG